LRQKLAHHLLPEPLIQLIHLKKLLLSQESTAYLSLSKPHMVAVVADLKSLAPSKKFQNSLRQQSVKRLLVLAAASVS